MAGNTLKGGLVALGLLGLALYSCGGTADNTTTSALAGTASDDTEASSVPASTSSGFDSSDENEGEDRAAFDEDDARDRAEEELASDSYVGAGASYGCTDDCSGHEAGWRYRADHGYAGSNPDSPSFEEGGQAFDEAVDDRLDEMRDSYERGEAEE